MGAAQTGQILMDLWMYETNHSPQRIAIAVALALMAHAILLIAISQVPWSPSIRQSTPLTVVIQHTEPERSEATPQSQPAEAVVSSTAGEPERIFKAPDVLPQRPRQMRPPTADTTWFGKLFTPQQSNSPEIATNKAAEVTEVSENDLPILSDYHRILLQALARNRYHDKQYPFSKLNSPKTVRLSLKLHSTGALLNVNVERSSGDEALDEAAKRSAFAASPFPAPPFSDEEFDYTYPVDIMYEPRDMAP